MQLQKPDAECVVAQNDMCSFASRKTKNTCHVSPCALNAQILSHTSPVLLSFFSEPRPPRIQKDPRGWYFYALPQNTFTTSVCPFRDFPVMISAKSLFSFHRTEIHFVGFRSSSLLSLLRLPIDLSLDHDSPGVSTRT